MSLTELESYLDTVLLDILVTPPSRAFVHAQLIGPLGLMRKIELLEKFVREHEHAVQDPEYALGFLGDMRDANAKRNRLVHDLHEIDFDDLSISRRRAWQDQALHVDLGELEEFASLLELQVGPGEDVFYVAMQPPGA